jgi:hypothetical protein
MTFILQLFSYAYDLIAMTQVLRLTACQLATVATLTAYSIQLYIQVYTGKVT